MTAPNPYQPPPSTADVPSPAQSLVNADSKAFLVRWAIALGINLIVPVAFATLLIAREDYLGLLLGVVIIFVAGALFGTVFAKFQRPLLTGSFALAFTQFLPILQIFAGGLALGMVEEIGFQVTTIDTEGEWITSTFGVLLATVITAIELAVVAMCFGGLYLALTKRARPTESVLPMA